MKQIFKYVLPVGGEVTLDLPREARILAVQVQRSTPCLWALVNPDAEIAPRQFWIVGTGHPADHVAGKTYVGTFQLLGGDLVFHVFADIYV